MCSFVLTRNFTRCNAMQYIPGITTADQCALCRCAIGPTEPVWFDWGRDPRQRGNYRPFLTSAICGACAKPDRPERVGLCETCGREVHNRSPWRFRSERCFCCHRCQSSAGARKAKTARASKRQGRICSVCGNSFDPGKGNAVTCSNACRQKTYRRRQASVGL
jgi:hypothetical protein